MARELVDALTATAMLGLKHKTGIHQFTKMGYINVAQEIPCNGGKQKKFLFFKDEIEALILRREYNKTPEGKREAAERGHRLRGRTPRKVKTEEEKEVCMVDNKLALFFICGKESLAPRKPSATAIRIGEEL